MCGQMRHSRSKRPRGKPTRQAPGDVERTAANRQMFWYTDDLTNKLQQRASDRLAEVEREESLCSNEQSSHVT